MRRAASATLRILLVVSRHPWPPRRGDQVRALQLAEALVALGHQVTLLAPQAPPGRREASVAAREDDRPGDEAVAVATADPARIAETASPATPAGRLGHATYRSRWSAVPAGLVRAGLSGRPWQSGLFDQPDLGRQLRELAPRCDLVVLQLVRLAAHVDDLGPTPFVVDLIDSLALNFERRAVCERPAWAPLFAWEGRRLLAAEARILTSARAGLLVGERDRAWLAGRLPAGLAAKLRVVPLAVPWPASPRSPPASSSGAAPPRLAITGNLGYFVNADAVCWWLAEVWPVVRRARPDLELVVAGARPGTRVRRTVAAAGARLLDTPRDLGAVLRAADVALAPTRAGSGVPIKVLEAWAAGVPVVASPWAAAGAAGRSGEDLLVAETADQWRDAVLALLADGGLRERLGAAGRRRIEREHSRPAVAAALAAALVAVTTGTGGES